MIQQAKLGVYRTNIPWLRGRWDETCSDDDAATVALRVKLRFPGKCTRDNFRPSLHHEFKPCALQVYGKTEDTKE